MSENLKSGELTFQQIFSLLKKSLLRMLIYVLIAAVLVGAIGLVIIFNTKGDEQYRAMIQLNYEGADEGLDPWGRALDVNKIKSNDIISSAIDIDLGNAEKQAELLENIKNNLSVSGVVPEDAMQEILIIKQIATSTPSALNKLTELSYYSTSYVITLTNTDKMNLESSDCIKILNGIVDNYIAYFKEAYGFGDALGTTIAEDIDFAKYDYIELSDVFETQLDSIITYLNGRISQSGKFRTTGSKMSFSDMKARVVAIKDYDVETLNAYVLDNGVTKEGMAISADTYIANKIKSINRSIEITDASIASTEAALAAWMPLYNTTTSPEGTTQQVLANGNVQVGLYDALTEYKADRISLQTQLKLWQERQATFNTVAVYTPEQKAVIWEKADKMVKDIYDAIKEEIAMINDAVDEYLQVEVMRDSVKKTVAATTVEADKSAYKTLLLVEVVVVVLACLVAIAVTSKKQKKAAEAPAPLPSAPVKSEEERPLRKRYFGK